MSIFDFFSKKRANVYNSAFAFFNVPTRKNLDFQKAYLENEWIYSAINKKASAISTSKLRIFKKRGENKVEIDKHPALDLINRPNDFLTRIDFLFSISLYLDLVGEAFFLIDKKANELWALEPDKMEVISDEKNFINQYKYNGTQTFKSDQILHFKEMNPVNQWRGASPLKSASETIDADNAAKLWNLKFFENGAKPSNILKTKENLSRDAIETLKKQWSQFNENVRNAHKTAILPSGLEFESTTSQKEMDFVNLGNSARDRILAILGVPKEIIGLVENTNRSNAEASEYNFKKNTILPRLIKIAEKLTLDFLPVFDNSEGLYFEFDDPTPENIELELKKCQTLYDIGAISPNEIREKFGMKPREGGNEFFQKNLTNENEFGKLENEIKTNNED